MISTKKIMAGKWHKLVCGGRKRICLISPNSDQTFVANRGNFVIYSRDKRRFVLPLAYLQHNIFQELLEISEQEFGLQASGPITLPCDSIFMNSLVPLFHHGLARNLDFAMRNSNSSSLCVAADYPLVRDCH